MNKMKRRLLPALIIALLALPTLLVFAKELGSLTVSGPGIKGEMTINDPKFTLEQSGFFDQSAFAKAPTNLNLDAGYSITAHLNMDGKIVPFAQMMYYPTEEGQSSYIHYTARLQGEALQPADDWYALSQSADTALRALMTANNVTLQSALVAASVKSESAAAEAPAASAAQPAVVPVTSSASDQSTYVILALAVTTVLLIGAGLTLRRRNVRAAS